MTKGAMIKPDSLAALDIPINLAAHPLWDQELDEPYLPLPGHPELRLTPNHVGDDADIVTLLTDPDVAKYAFIRPADYKFEHTAAILTDAQPRIQRTIDIIRPIIAAALAHIDVVGDIGSPNTAAPDLAVMNLQYPLPCIRHHPTGRLVGDLGFRLSRRHPKLPPPENRSDADEGNTDVGQEEEEKVVWEVGYNLSPEFRGQGVIKEAMAMALAGWGRWTGIKHLIAHTEPDNQASAAVLKSHGFVVSERYMQDWPEYNGDGQREFIIWELHL